MSYVDYENQLLCKEINEQARLFGISAEKEEEIARLQKVIAKCKEVLISNTSDLQEPNFVTLAAWRVREALALLDLASPVLNRVKAEALRAFSRTFAVSGLGNADLIIPGDVVVALHKMADAIEKGEALAAIKEEGL